MDHGMHQLMDDHISTAFIGAWIRRQEKLSVPVALQEPQRVRAEVIPILLYRKPF